MIKRITSWTIRAGLVVTAATASMALTSCAGGPEPTPAPTPIPASAPESAAEPLVDPIPPEVMPERSLYGARLIEYPAVSMAEREGEHIELVADLVIEEREDDTQYDYDDAVDVVVDPQGRLYVHDSERFRIIVYSPDGTFARAYGGAGEMAPFRLGWISVAGDKLAISTGNKITVWTLDGEYLYDRSLLRRAFGRGVQGTVNGDLVGSFEMLDRQRRWWYRIEKIALDEDESLAYGAVPARRNDLSAPRARAGFAATRDGAAYLTRGDEYRIQAFDADGYPSWVLTVDWPRAESPEPGGPPAPALANGRRGSRLATMGRGNPLRTDGRGNLYVFPYVDESWDRDEVPVDVYSPNGERLFAGFVSDVSWLRSQGDAIYGIEYDADKERQQIVRYRIAGPEAVAATLAASVAR